MCITSGGPVIGLSLLCININSSIPLSTYNFPYTVDFFYSEGIIYGSSISYIIVYALIQLHIHISLSDKRTYMGQKRKITLFRALFIILALAIYASTTAYAQANIDSATREVNRNVREKAEEELTPKIEKPPVIKEDEEPAETTGPKFLVKKITLMGTESVSVEKFQSLIDKYQDKEVSMEDLNILAKAIERQYLREGIIAACFVPPQDIKEGAVTLRVVEAKMGELQVKEGPFFDKDRIYNYWNVKPGEVLRYDKMSKSIQLMNKNPDRNVNATLHAGKKPETTDVLLDVKTYFPIHAFFSFDREGAVSTGRERIGMGGRHNNFLGVDDTLLAGYTFGKRFSGIYAYHSIPITNFGTSIMYGFSDSKSAPGKEFEPFVIKSESQNFSFYVNQDIYKGAEYMGEVSIGMDANDKASRTLAGGAGTLSRDRLRIMRVKSTLIHRFPGAITYMTPQFSQGMNIFGARGKNEFSSRNVENTPSIFNLTMKHRRSLPLNLETNINFKWQWASEKLPSQEAFSMGGIDSVRGYPSQDYVADTGFTTNFELLIPAFFIPESIKLPYAPTTVKDSITGIVFFDYGWGYKRGDISGEQTKDQLMGAGAGVRIRLYNQAVARLEWGYPLGDRLLTEGGRGLRFHFSLNFEDRLQEEWERISAIRKEDDIKKQAWQLVNSELEDPNSPVSQKLNNDLAMAELAQSEGRLQDAKKYYEQVQQISKSLYNQAEIYIRSTYDLEIKLQEQNKEAEELYRKGDIEKAKAIWEKIQTKAALQPLVLDLQ